MIAEDGSNPIGSSPVFSNKSEPNDPDAIESMYEQDCNENSTHRVHRNMIQESADRASSIFRPKSPSSRSKNPSARYRPYQPHAVDSIRKTKSSALPAPRRSTRTSLHAIGETASTPDLPDNGNHNDENGPPTYNENDDRDEEEEESKAVRLKRIRDLNRQALLYENLQWSCVFLNFSLLIIGLLYFVSAINFTLSKDILLSLMSLRNFGLSLAFFYAFGLLSWIVALTGLQVVRKWPRRVKHHAWLTSMVSVVTLSFVFLQNSAQRSIEEGVEKRLFDSLDEAKSYDESASWAYFHDTFKCCGVTGFLDWCNRVNSTGTDDYLGTYICYVPDSCCGNYVVESVRESASSNVTCIDLLDSNKIRNYGCITFIKREIYYLGKTYRTMTICAEGALVLLTIVSASLSKFV